MTRNFDYKKSESKFFRRFNEMFKFSLNYILKFFLNQTLKPILFSHKPNYNKLSNILVKY